MAVIKGVFDRYAFSPTVRASLWQCLCRFRIDPFSVFADTVWMKNGDRLTGTVRSLNEGKLVMDTSYGGTLSLNWTAVSTLSSEKPIDVRSSGQTFKKRNWKPPIRLYRGQARQR